MSAISFVVSHLKGTFVCSFDLFLVAQPNTSRYKPPYPYKVGPLPSLYMETLIAAR